MSPEQASGEPRLDGRTDQYSLGCVLYEMLAGEPPYTGPTAQAIIAKRLSEPVPHLSTAARRAPARRDGGHPGAGHARRPTASRRAETSRRRSVDNSRGAGTRRTAAMTGGAA